MLTKRTRLILLIAAGALILMAAIWSLVLYNTGDGDRICRQINAFGYTFAPDDLYVAGTWENSSIRALLPEEELTSAIEASLRAGFPSDVDQVGAVALLLANPAADDAVTLFLVNNEIELAFVQTAGGAEIWALGE